MPCAEYIRFDTIAPMKTLITVAMFALCLIAFSASAQAQIAGVPTSYGVAYQVPDPNMPYYSFWADDQDDSLQWACSNLLPGTIDMSRELNNGNGLICVLPWFSWPPWLSDTWNSFWDYWVATFN